jgi:hypothetical protein
MSDEFVISILVAATLFISILSINKDISKKKRDTHNVKWVGGLDVVQCLSYSSRSALLL